MVGSQPTPFNLREKEGLVTCNTLSCTAEMRYHVNVCVCYLSFDRHAMYAQLLHRQATMADLMIMVGHPTFSDK